jgi:hypothetical protein
MQPQAGVFGLATQSGAFGSATYGMATLRGIGLSRDEAIARLRNQLPIEDKVKQAHDVIWNEGTLQELELQTMQWLQKMRSMSSSVNVGFSFFGSENII